MKAVLKIDRLRNADPSKGTLTSDLKNPSLKSSKKSQTTSKSSTKPPELLRTEPKARSKQFSFLMKMSINSEARSKDSRLTDKPSSTSTKSSSKPIRKTKRSSMKRSE
jgi:hypothetical protein